MGSCVTLLVVFAATTFAQSYASGVATRHSTFDPVPTSARTGARAGKRALPLPRATNVPPRPPQLDSTAGGEPRQALANTATVSFPGIAQTRYSPPSPNIAAGPEDVLEVVNASVARFTRDGVMTDSVTIQQWFASNFPT